MLILYEGKVLDSIQFLFDLGFVPRVALSHRNPLDRAAVVKAVRRQIDSGGKVDPLLLGAWPRGSAKLAAAGGVDDDDHGGHGRDGERGGDIADIGGGVGNGSVGGASAGGRRLDEEKGAATALGLRILSTSR